MRVLLSTNIPCKSGCKYCFAKWDSYKPLDKLPLAQMKVDKESLILYPCCDGDCFYQTELAQRVEQLASDFQQVYVSISSKTFPSDEQIVQWRNLHQELVMNKKGFLKFAISISNRSMLDEIEPGTMPYEDRLKLTQIIKGIEIPLSLTLKPVLPFIAEKEYRAILADFRPYIKNVLIGGLYADKTTDFYARYLTAYRSTKRKVSWIPGSPEWEYIEDATLIDKIKEDAEHLDMQVFFSDRDLIESIAGEQL